MRALIRVGLALLILAFVLIGLSYTMLRAQGVTARPEGRAVTTDTRPLERRVRAIELNAPVDLIVRYGPQPALVVRGEQRLLQNIETNASGDTLRISTRGLMLRHRQPLEVEVTLPVLDSLSVDGSGNTRVNGFSGERIDVSLNGSGRVQFNGRYRQARVALHGSGELSLDAGNSDSIDAELMGSGAMSLAGATRHFKLESSGSGTLDAQRLRAEEAQLRQTGSGSATVTVRDTVSASVSGSGDIDVHGEPSQRSVSRTGSGTVHFIE